mgnify:CR=1 FL=1
MLAMAGGTSLNNSVSQLGPLNKPPTDLLARDAVPRRGTLKLQGERPGSSGRFMGASHPSLSTPKMKQGSGAGAAD